MAINLLDLVKDQITGQLAKQASSFLGESESSVSSALGSIMPVLLGSAIQKSSSPSGAQGIMDIIGKLDLNSLGDITKIFGGGADSVNGILNSGGGIVDTLLGKKSSGVIDLISSLSGMKSGSTSSLLKMAAPFLMSIIGNQIKGKGLSGLTDLLLGQKSAVNAALPSGLGSLLNFGNFDLPKIDTNISAPAGGNNWMKWLLPVLLGLALVYWLSTKGCGNKVVEESKDALNTVNTELQDASDAAGNAIDKAGEAVANLFKFKLNTGFELIGAQEGGIESQLVNFVSDNTKVVDKNTWFNFDRLLFDTGKATLQPQSQEQLKNVAEILKAFPKVKLKIGGYTDNVGDSKKNLVLSTDRAFNVMNELVNMGVAKDRLSAEGYGDQHPVADNNTEEGRQQNRRISVRVTEK
ncbi:MAG TPA: OmpA family protein [Saprospiraceae bacterium]|nr:OmpA family protein [Saprospiraceae bacterium]HRO08112.1 OmpA family protein [Saprospiraceae bacterium]HRP41505.1 OmpA family protein [Saprospiraceae bacterium]